MRASSAAKRLRDRAEAALVRGFVALARHLPPRATVRFGEWLGGWVGRLDRGRREVALRNLELAYGGALAPAERRRIVRGVYRHFGRFLFEDLLFLAQADLRPFSRFITIDNVERSRAAVREHGAAIFVTLHQGHWDLLGGALAELVAPVHAVMTPLRNPRLNEMVLEIRGRLGMGVIGRENAVPALFRLLRRGQSVGLLCDFNQKEGGEFIDFFGTKAATVRTPGVLAMRSGKPVICSSSWSTGEPLNYRGAFGEPIVPRSGGDPEAEVRRILVEMNRQLEGFVRAHPEQWNWIHPRWKTRPPGESPPALG